VGDVPVTIVTFGRVEVCFFFRFGNCIALHVQAGMEYRNEWETGPKEWIPREFEREFEKLGFFFRSSFSLLMSGQRSSMSCGTQGVQGSVCMQY
jgi:hypothetical protein